MQVILIDTFGFFFRSFYALPPLFNSKGFPTSLLTGFANLIFDIFKKYKGACIIFTLEGHENKRKEIYKDYKANRSEAPADLLAQLPVAISWLEDMGLKTLQINGYEADDCIASLSHLAQLQGFSVQIISHDKDLYQLISQNVSLYDYSKKRVITALECEQKFGVKPSEFITYQSIVGDSSDNIPGIKGIGAKGALKILEHFKSLEELYDAISADFSRVESLLGKRVVKLILDSKENAFLSRRLVTLCNDLLPSYDFMESKNDFENSPLLKIAPQLREYEMFKILDRIRPIVTNSNTLDSKKSLIIESKKSPNLESKQNLDSKSFSFKSHLITDSSELFSILDSIPKDKIIAFDCETTGLDYRSDKMVGFSFCFDGVNGYYVAFLHNTDSKQVSISDAKIALQKIFTHPLIGHNIKFDLQFVLHNFGIYPQKNIKDSMILAWLLSPGEKISLDFLMDKFFNHKMISFESVLKSIPKKQKSFADVELISAANYASEDAVATFGLFFRLESLLDSVLINEAKNIEFPFISVIIAMENSGISVDVAHFAMLKKDFEFRLQNLTQKIYEQSGYEFNINSPQQTSEILFDKLALSTKGNNKKSTNEIYLANITNEHPVIATLLTYREVFKLYSSYIEPILRLSNAKKGENKGLFDTLDSKDSNDRIYTQFLQTGTATGRLSSKSPNLQNISVRSELGKSIRAGFIARNGYKLASLDYSQIELRLLAHFSGDSTLIRAFEQNADIHAQTAKMIFGDSIAGLHNADSIESSGDFATFRNIAKSINFGLIYGMGARKLAQTLQISQIQAKEYIDKYFAKLPHIRDFLESKRAEIQQNGYAETLFKRRRYFDFSIQNEGVRQGFLREGVNTIFQGSAADLIKKAMIEICAAFNLCLDSKHALSHDGDYDIKLLLQVHDELIFEIKESLVESYTQKIKQIMESTYKLKVPLICNATSAHTWAELK